MVKRKFVILDQRLSHLSDEQIEDLMKRYYDNEKVSLLIEEYNIDVLPSALHSIFPPEVLKMEKCPYCNVMMYKKRKSKRSYGEEVIFCKTCGHNFNIICKCPGCIEKMNNDKLEEEKQRKMELMRKRDLLLDVYKSQSEAPQDINDLTFKQRIYLAALMKCGFDEGCTVISPLENFRNKLAPTEELIQEIMTELITNMIILVDPESELDAINELKDEERLYDYDEKRVSYRLNVVCNDNPENLIERLFNPSFSKDVIKKYGESFWREIALHECIEYLLLQMNKVDFIFTPGRGTCEVLDALLKTFSVSQIFGIIYKSTSNASRYYLEGKISRNHAANSVITGCQRYGERAISEGWEIKSYNRIKECQQSVLSELYFNVILGIEELGFMFPPTKIID